MPKFGDRSQEELNTCHSDLVRLCERVVKVYDITVLEGHRSEERQAELVRNGTSKLAPGKSKHNKSPSLAVDIAPFPIDWKDLNRFHFLAGLMFMAAADEGVALRWGGDWDRDFDFTDQEWFDLPHFELVL